MELKGYKLMDYINYKLGSVFDTSDTSNSINYLLDWYDDYTGWYPDNFTKESIISHFNDYASQLEESLKKSPSIFYEDICYKMYMCRKIIDTIEDDVEIEYYITNKDLGLI